MPQLNPDRWVWPCLCGDTQHLLEFYWDEEEPEFSELMIATTWWERRLWGRIKGAWQVLRGHHYTAADRMLTPKNVRDLVAILSRHQYDDVKAQIQGLQDREEYIESLEETVDILSDPETVAAIEEADSDFDSWPSDFVVTEQRCETCGVWLGYNYPAFHCRDCQSKARPG